MRLGSGIGTLERVMGWEGLFEEVICRGRSAGSQGRSPGNIQEKGITG